MAGGWGSNLSKTMEDFFCWEKYQICTRIPSGTPTLLSLSLLMAQA